MEKFIERLMWGTDAGFYRRIPVEVLMPENAEAVVAIIERARREGKSITFRAAGTSLSGQSSGDSLLVVCGKKWERAEVLEGGQRIRLQPGVVGGRVNALLKPYGYRFTPDPASLESAMVGGIVANNASGMCCGTHANSYRMLESVRLVFADGSRLDTGDATSRAAFAASHPDFLARIVALRERTRADKSLVERIRHKYTLKNVTGLTILPFIEYDDPIDIIAHLIPGSEGTLAFLEEVTMRTGELPVTSESALLLFPTTVAACEAVTAMKATDALAAAEYFDRKAMRTVEKDFPELAGLPEDAGAVLVKTEGMSTAEIEYKRKKLEAVLVGRELLSPAIFTADPKQTGKWWAMRSGIFPAVGGTRPIGTTCLIEDIAVPVSKLAEATAELQRLFREHGYWDAVIYGHALEGNWHFILNQRFDTPEAIAQYDAMMHAVVDLVVDKYDGSLKAEHGTGRNMAPFVRREWGDAAYALMREVKELFDPEGIFNPGVIFNEDPKSYLERIKPLPRVHDIVDRCIECGFCEVNCVAHGFAMSSRQRIVVQREIARLESVGDQKGARRLRAAFRLIGKDLCAGDGLCSLRCPVGINVGELIHEIRHLELSQLEYSIGAMAAEHLNLFASAACLALGAAQLGRTIIGAKAMAALGRLLHTFSAGLVPLWTVSVPGPARRHTELPSLTDGLRPRVVYFPSCINQRLGAAPGGEGKTVVEETLELLAKAGYEVSFPANRKNLCCGTIWESKGMPDLADKKTAELEAALRAAGADDKTPVLCDQSPCLHRMRERIKGLKLYEPAEFIETYLLDRLAIEPLDACVAIHITCSMRRMGLADTIIQLAKHCARKVIVPDGVGCCAFAGDKGFTHPELNAWALRNLREQVTKSGAIVGFSNSRTCEIGLTTHSGIVYESIVSLVNRVARAKVEN